MKKLTIILALFFVAAFFFKRDLYALVTQKTKEPASKQSALKSGKIEQWDLPNILFEVSGIAWLDANRFAAVQDEVGTVYIYNRSTNKIEKEIPFAGPGDYEGLAVDGDRAWVIRSDGHLYSFNMSKGISSVKEYANSTLKKNNIEGLCFDKKNNRLLLAEKNGKGGVYAFDLATNLLEEEPIFRIQLDGKGGGKKDKGIQTSEIAINPVTGDYYVAEGPRAMLYILDSKGNFKSSRDLGKGFAKAEGITFSPAGDLFISNEGKKNPGNIIQVTP